MRILIVDDDSASREMLQAGLAGRGWEVETAGDGEEGLAAIRRRSFDAVVSDILMPRMDGYRLCQSVRADPKVCDIPFFFCTATYTSREEKEFALAIGADGLVAKPAELDDLVALLEPLLLRSSSSVRQLLRATPQADSNTLQTYDERLVKRLEDELVQLKRTNLGMRDALEVADDDDEVGVWQRLVDEPGREVGQSEELDVTSIDVVPEIIEYAPVAIVISDSGGFPVCWNPAAEKLLGLPLDGDAADDGHRELVQRLIAREHADAVKRMLGGETLRGVTTGRSAGEDGHVDLVLWGGPLRHGGRIVGTFAIIHDITERSRAEAALKVDRERLEELVETRTRELMRANSRLEDAAHAKSAFLAGMGHEMRSQLNSIIGFSGTLMQGLSGELSDEQRRQIGMVYEAGQSLVALVNDVVDLSRIEAGQLAVRIAPFELLGFLERIVASFRASAEDAGIDLVLDAPRGVMPMHSDAAKIEQVMRNILSNAVKFTSQGSVRVEVESADDGSSVVIRVRDTGPGIPPDVMSEIFDEFVKYDLRHGGGKEGTGLGLALTRRLCEMLGGSVSARSNPGEGSVFTAVLPVDISPAKASAGGPVAGRTEA